MQTEAMAREEGFGVGGCLFCSRKSKRPLWDVVSSGCSGCSGGRSGWGGFGEADFDCTQRGGKPLEGLEQGSNKVVKLLFIFP